MNIDFTVPVIDNFGDMGFALSLALSMLGRDNSLAIRFYSEDSELFRKMLGGNTPTGLSYHSLASWSGSERSEVRFNFFGYKIREDELVGHENPKRILNFDYLQFHKGSGTHDPGIGSLHGTKYELGGKKIAHIVPSPLPEGGWVVIPSAPLSHTKESFLEELDIDTEIASKKWCSVFVYPETIGFIEGIAAEYPEWIFLICGGCDISWKNIVKIPFLPLASYSELLTLCDANIVRGENSLVSAMLAGKPFLWDIYREKNGAHEEKIRDLGAYADQYVSWSKTLADFVSVQCKRRGVRRLLETNENGFSDLEKAILPYDIGQTALRFLRESD